MEIEAPVLRPPLQSHCRNFFQFVGAVGRVIPSQRNKFSRSTTSLFRGFVAILGGDGSRTVQYLHKSRNSSYGARMAGMAGSYPALWIPPDAGDPISGIYVATGLFDWLDCFSETGKRSPGNPVYPGCQMNRWLTRARAEARPCGQKETQRQPNITEPTYGNRYETKLGNKNC